MYYYPEEPTLLRNSDVEHTLGATLYQPRPAFSSIVLRDVQFTFLNEGGRSTNAALLLSRGFAELRTFDSPQYDCAPCFHSLQFFAKSR